MITLPNIGGLVTMGKTLVMANRPELLFGASITATLGAVVLAAKGGWDARGMVDETDAERTVSGLDPLTPRQIANLTWHCYMPAAVTTLTAVGSTTGLHIVHVKEKKALAQAALVAIDEVKKSAVQFEKDNLGVVSDEEKDVIMKKREEEQGFAHVESSDGVLEEMYLVRDGKTGRDIWSNQHRIEDALIEVCNVINGSGEVELNHFYHHAGFNVTKDGLKYGWSGTLPTLQWEETKRDDGRPVRVFHFRPEPEAGYDDHHR